MSSPARRPTPAVYRRRRLAVIAVLLLITGLIVLAAWLLISQPWAGATGEPSSSPTATRPANAATAIPVPGAETPASDSPDESSAASAPATYTPPAAEPCDAGSVSVTAVTDKESYAAGENPQLSIQLTNSGTVDCTMNVGTAAQVFTITSGSDVWWRSTDCQSEPADQVVLLAAGSTVASAEPLVWDRTRSSVDTCEGDRQAAPGGGATYNLTVAVGGVISSAPRTFFLN